MQKRRLSSNVTTVSSKELERMKQGRIDQVLQNALPNVQITMSSGQAGATSLVKSRGLSSAFSNSTPVIYVDGVRVDNMNTGATLNNSLSGNSAVTGSIGDIPMENIDHIEYVTVVRPLPSMVQMQPMALFRFLQRKERSRRLRSLPKLNWRRILLLPSFIILNVPKNCCIRQDSHRSTVSALTVEQRSSVIVLVAA